MKTRLIALALLLSALACVPASAQQTYVLGNWTVTAKQDKGIKWLFNQKNAELQAAATIQAAGSRGGVTGITLTRKGVATTHQAAANHSTTGGTGSGAVIRYNAYTDVANLLTRNGGVLDAAVTSYAQQREQQRNDAVRSALDGATDTQVTNALAALGMVDPQ